ncbi:MAG: glycosyltransferase family 9 protein [Anaerolineae bacterium]
MNPWLEARNIVAMRLDNLGDVVMTGPALRAVKETSPQARITLLGSTGGVAAAPLLPWIDETIPWRSIWQDLGHLPFDPARERELIEMLAARRFDAALIFTSFSQTPHAPGYVAYLAGIPLRAGESKEFGGRVLTTELKGAPDEMHQVERNLRLVETLGFSVRDRSLAIAISDEARETAPQLLMKAGVSPHKPYILLHPGASAKSRRYPPERSGQVAEMLARRGWQVLVTGVEREKPILDVVAANAPHAHFLIAETTLPAYAALVERAQLVICGNTLPLHLADATGTPVLSLYSGTDYETQWAPRRVPHRLLRRPTACYPCYLFDCPIGQPCLDFDPDEVVSVAEEMLAEESLAYAG